MAACATGQLHIGNDFMLKANHGNPDPALKSKSKSQPVHEPLLYNDIMSALILRLPSPRRSGKLSPHADAPGRRLFQCF